MIAFLAMLQALLLACQVQSQPSEQQAFVAPVNLEFIKRHDQSKSLSLFWSQEFIGLDLAREAVNELDPDHALEARIGTIEALNGVYFPESVFEPSLLARMVTNASLAPQHGDLTGSILAGSPLSASSRGRFFLANPERHAYEKGLKAMGQILEDRRLSGQPELDVFSYSIDLEAGSETLVILGEQGTLLFQSAGNDFPFQRNARHALTDHTMMVSNVSPLGITALSSSESETTIIGAPAANIQRVEVNANVLPFSGTSGSTPLVAGVMADMRALLPGISRSEAKQLLQQTAIPTNLAAYSGNGSLNAFKLIKVAARLRADWPQNRQKIAEDSSLYDFKSESEQLTAEATELYTSQSNEQETRLAIDMLRKAFHLTPTNSRARKLLGDIYRSAGLVINAIFYEKLGELSASETLVLLNRPDFAITFGDLLRHSSKFPDHRTDFVAVVQRLMKGDLISEKDQLLQLAKDAKRSGIDPFVILLSGLDLPTSAIIKIDDERATKIDDVCAALFDQESDGSATISQREAFHDLLLLKSFTIIDRRQTAQVERLLEVLGAVILDSERSIQARSTACSEYNE